MEQMRKIDDLEKKVISLEEKINILYPKLKINNDLDDWVQPVCDIELFDYCYWIYNVWKNDRMGTLLEVWI